MADRNMMLNLRLLCSFEPSVSEVCRAIGINRQQFGKYLNGQSQPSPYNLHRIAGHFGIAPADLDSGHEAFAAVVRATRRVGAPSGLRRVRPLAAAFDGDLRTIRRYLGYYLIYCHSFSWPGRVIRGLSRLWERDGYVCSTSIERFRDPVDGLPIRTRYEGEAVLIGNHLFIVEHQQRGRDAITSTVLDARPRSSLSLLSGVTLGFASNERQPYTSRSVYRFAGQAIDLKSTLKTLGLLEYGKGRIDPGVERLLGPPSG